MSTYKLLKEVYYQIQDYYLYDLYQSLIQQYQTGGTLLEIGALEAHISRSVASYFDHVLAFDIEMDAIKKANQLGPKNFFAFVHDMHKPLKDTFDMIIAPIDVFNHALNFEDFKKIIHIWTACLKPSGIFIFDVLRCSYLESLSDYEEPLKEGLIWKVERLDEPCMVKHIIKAGDQVETHIEKSYDEKFIETALNHLKLLKKHVLEDRIIYVYKK